MGLFKGVQDSRTDKIPVELVTPSSGRIVELEVTEKNDTFAKYYMSLILAYAEGIKEHLVKYESTDRKIKFTFKEGTIAQKVREIFA